MRLNEVKFTGTLKIVDGVGLVREIDPESPRYVGAPTSEMDAAWDEIIYRMILVPFMTVVNTHTCIALNLFLTEKEMEGNQDGASPDPETGLYVAM